MLSIKGFVTIAQYVNNNPGQVSALGELSTWSMTYTKERGEYISNIIPGYKLHSFKCIDESLIPQSIPQAQVDQTLQIIQAAVVYATSHIRPYDPLDFRNTILGSFFGRISDLTLGAFVDNGALALPEYIEYVSTEHNDNLIKVWLADQSFQDQYDEYEIEVIPPMLPLDDFFGFYAAAVTRIQDRTLTDLTLDIQAIKDVHPETYLKLLEFNYYNRLNLNQVTKTNWAILIYGKAGDQIDKIKDALVDYILNNSTYARQDWAVIFPDIFKRTEFAILPRWDLLSIPNLSLQSGLYSSMMDPIDCVNFALAHIDFYPDPWIEDNITIMPIDYKAIMLVVVNGNDNVLANAKLNEVFPDYIPVSSLHLDFDRMTIKTREWVLLLEQLLIAAESATLYNTIPGHLRRIVRNGILYISVLYENVNYLVAAKSNSFYQE